VPECRNDNGTSDADDAYGRAVGGLMVTFNPTFSPLASPRRDISADSVTSLRIGSGPGSSVVGSSIANINNSNNSSNMSSPSATWRSTNVLQQHLPASRGGAGGVAYAGVGSLHRPHSVNAATAAGGSGGAIVDDVGQFGKRRSAQECRLVVTPTCLGLVVYRNTLPLVIFVQLFDHNSFT
jgi:hypothetical protein